MGKKVYIYLIKKFPSLTNYQSNIYFLQGQIAQDDQNRNLSEEF